jgi:hypothetical protein
VSRDDRRVEESLRKIQQDLSELKLEIKSGKSSAPAPAAVAVAEPITPVNWRMLYSAESTQELIKSNIDGTVKGNTIWLMSYSFDRRELMESLAAAQRREARIIMISDHRQSLKGPREQLSILQEVTTWKNRSDSFLLVDYGLNELHHILEMQRGNEHQPGSRLTLWSWLHI